MKANATTALKTAVANAVKSTLSAGSGSKLLQVYSGAGGNGFIRLTRVDVIAGQPCSILSGTIQI